MTDAAQAKADEQLRFSLFHAPSSGGAKADKQLRFPLFLAPSSVEQEQEGTGKSLRHNPVIRGTLHVQLSRILANTFSDFGERSMRCWRLDFRMHCLPSPPECIAAWVDGSLAITVSIHRPLTSRYTKYVMRDPLGAIARTSAATKGAGDTQGNLMAAPASMSGASQRDVPHEAFLYTPGRGQAPQMNVPAALPDLPGENRGCGSLGLVCGARGDCCDLCR